MLYVFAFDIHTVGNYDETENLGWLMKAYYIKLLFVVVATI